VLGPESSACLGESKFTFEPALQAQESKTKRGPSDSGLVERPIHQEYSSAFTGLIRYVADGNQPDVTRRHVKPRSLDLGRNDSICEVIYPVSFLLVLLHPAK
jgi:hypothetical protein